MSPASWSTPPNDASIDEEVERIGQLHDREVVITIRFAATLDKDGDFAFPDINECLAECDDDEVDFLYLTKRWLALHADVRPVLPDPTPEDVQEVVKSIETAVRNRTRDANA